VTGPDLNEEIELVDLSMIFLLVSQMPFSHALFAALLEDRIANLISIGSSNEGPVDLEHQAS
jgi:hypothetical protein